VLRQAPQSAEPEVRIYMAIALAALGDRTGTEAMYARLQAAERLPRVEMVEGSDDSAYVPLQSPATAEWENTMRALAQFKTVAARQLIASELEGKGYLERILLGMPDLFHLDSDTLRLGLNDKDPRIRVIAATIAARQDDPRGMDELSSAATARDPRVRIHAIAYLAQSRSPQALELLRTALRNPVKDSGDGIWRAIAVSAVGKAGNVSDIPLLMTLMESPDQSVVAEAVNAVVALSRGDGIRLLAPKLEGKHEATAISAAGALAYLIEGEK
jgi:HEAT repeat protein